MTPFRFALRSLATRPVRSAVLAFGFGFGIAVMAALLGVGEVILEQAQSPDLQGGGDVSLHGEAGGLTSARFVARTVLGSPGLAERVAALSPTRTETVFLMRAAGEALPVRARGGIPSLERAIGDPETAQVSQWVDAPGDARWTAPDAGELLRAMDRFHPVPRTTLGAEYDASWAEWLYFNGRTADGATRFYLSFLVGPGAGSPTDTPGSTERGGRPTDTPGSTEPAFSPESAAGRSAERSMLPDFESSAAVGATGSVLSRPATPARRLGLVRLQLDRDGRQENYVASDLVPEDDLLANAPDLAIGRSRVVLEGTEYRIHLELVAEDGTSGRWDLSSPGLSRPETTVSGSNSGRKSSPGSAARRFPQVRAGRAGGSRSPGKTLGADIVLDAAPGRSLPPFTIRGARGWVSGYTVPVLSGVFRGALTVSSGPGHETISLEGARGYHDHNWGFWHGVTWQWGQVARDDLSIVYGRVHPPAEAADPRRVPGFLAALGPDGPLGFATDVEIEERGPDADASSSSEPRANGIAHVSSGANAAGEERLPVNDAPVSIHVRARGQGLDLLMTLRVRHVVATPAGGEDPVRFLQMRGDYEVSGHAGARTFAFTAPGAAETFRKD